MHGTTNIRYADEYQINRSETLMCWAVYPQNKPRQTAMVCPQPNLARSIPRQILPTSLRCQRRRSALIGTERRCIDERDHRLTTELSDSRRQERWSARGAHESPPSVERRSGAAVRSSGLVGPCPLLLNRLHLLANRPAWSLRLDGSKERMWRLCTKKQYCLERTDVG